MFAFGATSWDTDDIAVGTNGDTASMSGGPSSQTLTASLYTNDPVFYTHAIAQPGSSQTLTASLYSNASVFYNHSLSIPGSDPSLTLGPLKNNTGTLLSSQSSITVYVYTLAGALVTTKTGQSTDGSGIISFTDSAMTASTMYRAVIVMSGGAEGMIKATAV
jgi:hypothetical protein